MNTPWRDSVTSVADQLDVLSYVSQGVTNTLMEVYARLDAHANDYTGDHGLEDPSDVADKLKLVHSLLVQLRAIANEMLEDAR